MYEFTSVDKIYILLAFKNEENITENLVLYKISLKYSSLQDINWAMSTVIVNMKNSFAPCSFDIKINRTM